MDDALKNVDEMPSSTPTTRSSRCSRLYPGTESFEEGAKKGLFAADCWDRMMKDPFCGVEVPACWEEHSPRRRSRPAQDLPPQVLPCGPSLWPGRSATWRPPRVQAPAGGALSILKLELLNATSRTAPGVMPLPPWRQTSRRVAPFRVRRGRALGALVGLTWSSAPGRREAGERHPPRRRAPRGLGREDHAAGELRQLSRMESALADTERAVALLRRRVNELGAAGR
ncbi:MAG: hypothetical protein IPO67_15115 [Deltaproteobacteria bacterium]|nr:hypothetical protein [Deltaproteobacteria bacterium]